MKTTKKTTNGHKTAIILENEQGIQIVIEYAGCDLYWTMHGFSKSNSFSVTKDDGILFTGLTNMFKYIKNNDNPYNKTLNDNCFTWISEAEGELENANYLTITQEKEQFIIKFYQNPNYRFNTKDMCAVCFCLSGSKNDKIASAFSIMFQEYLRIIPDIKSKSLTPNTKTTQKVKS